MTLPEQETITRYNRAEKIAIIDTFNHHDVVKFLRLCSNYPEDYHLLDFYKDQDGNIIGASFSLSSKDLITFRKPRAKRDLSAEERQAIRLRLKGSVNDEQKQSR